MAIAIRGGTPLVVSTTSNPVSGTLTGTRQPQTGDLLVIIHGNDFFALSNMDTPTVGGSTTGVTAITNGTADGGTDNAHAKSYTFAVTSTGDLTVEATENGSADEEKVLAVYVLSGADTGSPIDGGSAGAAGTAGATSASHVLTGVAPSAADAFLIGHDNAGGGSGSGTPYTTPGGTEQYDGATGGISYCGWTEQLSASGATGTRTVTPANAISFAGLVIAIKTSAGGTNAPAEVATAAAVANDATVNTTNIRKVADRGSTQNVTTGTSSVVDLAAGASIAVGNYLIARVALDNAGSNGAAPTLSVSDPGGNTWTVAGPANIDPGAANAGSTCYIAYAKITTGLANGDDVTFTYNVSVPAKAIVVEEWTNIHAATPVAVAATTATGTSTTPSIARTPLAIGQVFYGALSVEGPTGDTFTQDSDTTDGAWTTLTRLSTGDATATNNQTINGVAKLVTGTTAQTWNPTITSRDWAQVALVFAEAVAATNANAENAACSGVAESPTVGVSPTVEHAAATAAANDATVTIGGATDVPAEAATATAAALDPTVSVAASGDVSAGTGDAHDATTTVQPVVDFAAATGSAETPTVVTGTLAVAECAVVSGAALDGTTRVAPVVGHAAALAEALFDATGGSVSLELTADSPVTATATANDATISTAAQTFANAQSATATGAAETPSVALAVPAASATAAAVAENPTAAVATTADSGTAAAAAETSTVTVALGADTASAVGAALDASVSTSAAANAPAENAGATTSAETPTILVATSADTAPAIATAADGSVSTSGQGTALAETAAATAPAADPAAAVQAAAENALAAGVADAPAVALAASADVATATAATNDATAATSGQGSASAEVAVASAIALDANTTVLFGAEVALAAGVANDATVSTVAGATATPEAASAAGSALDPSIQITTNAALAVGLADAPDPVAAVAVIGAAESALAAALALDPTLAIQVSAEAAAAAASSFNPTFQLAGGSMAPVDRAAPTMLGVV